MTADPPPTHRRHQMLRRAGMAQLGQAFLLLGGITAILFGLSVLAVILQAQRDEVRNADWMLIAAPKPPDPALINHVVAQQRRNFSPRIVIVGAAAQDLAQQLEESGMLAANLELADPAPLSHQLRSYASEAQAPTTVLIVAAPEHLVVLQKMSRDIGMNALVGAPPQSALRIGTTLSAAVHYWRYVLVGEA